VDRSTLYNVANLKTGDIILFSGKCFVSRVIKFVTNSPWSHIGMIVNNPEHDTPMLYESSHDHGVRLTPFNEYRRAFVGDMALRRLKHDLSDKEHYRLRIFKNQVRGTPFEANAVQMLASVPAWWFLSSREDLSSMFCSELVAQCYKEIGLLGQDRASNKYTPAAFSAERNLPLTRGELGPQILIKEYVK
tara:strand:- start:29 stop:598 length:570 start_codon:yes stop_codon:yes gene_type:complete